jgi:hypothetical protein
MEIASLVISHKKASIKEIEKALKKADDLEKQNLSNNKEPDSIKPEEPEKEKPESEEDINSETPEEQEVEKPVETEKPSSVEAEDFWETRFKSYKSSTDKTIFTLRKENKALQSSLQILNEKLEKLEPVAVEAEKAEKSKVMNKLAEELGEDSANILDSYINKALEPLKQENDVLRQKLAAVEDITVENLAGANKSALIERIKPFVPDFDAIDNDPQFKAYISSLDPVTNRPITDLLQEAAQSDNLRFIVSTYNEYANRYYAKPEEPEKVSGSEQNTKNPFVEAISKAKEQRSPEVQNVDDNMLESRVAPGTSNPAPTNSSTVQGKVWTRQEIKQFYTDSALKRLSPELEKNLKADIESAYKEGRVI